MVSPGLLKWAQGVFEEQAEAERKRLEAETKKAEAARKALEQAKNALLQRSAKAQAFLETAMKEFNLEFEGLKAISEGFENELKTEYAWLEIDFKLKELKDMAQLKTELGRIDSEEKERIPRLRTLVQACVFYVFEAERLVEENRVEDAVKVINVVENLIKETEIHEEYLIKLEKYKEQVAEKHKKAEIEHGYRGERLEKEEEAESFVVDKELLRVRKLAKLTPGTVQSQVAIDANLVEKLVSNANAFLKDGRLVQARESLKEAKNVLKTLSATISKEKASALEHALEKVGKRIDDMYRILEIKKSNI